MLPTAFALACVAQYENNNVITAKQVQDLLADVKGTTFAQITQVTKVDTAAAHKAEHIYKVTVANVQLFNNLQEFTSVYADAVKRSAAKIDANDVNNIDSFTAQETYYEHTDCYSIVKHKTQDIFYLYAIYNGAQSVYVHNNNVVDKQHVAQFCTPSAAKKLLQEDNVVVNKTHDVAHTVTVRTPKLTSIVSITAQKQTLSV